MTKRALLIYTVIYIASLCVLIVLQLLSRDSGLGVPLAMAAILTALAGRAADIEVRAQ
jgi:hypothetical protein